MCGAASQEKLQVRDYSADALICCSINTETKPAPANKITIDAIFIENSIADVCAQLGYVRYQWIGVRNV